MKKLLSALLFCLLSAPSLAGDALLATWGAPDFWFGAGISGTNSQTLTTKSLQTQYDGVAMTWVATKTDTITDIGFHQASMTGTPTSGSYSVAIFPLTTGGLPNTGATFANATLGSVTVTTFTPSAGTNAWKWVNLGANTYSVTQGQELAIVVWRNAATDASNKISVDPSVGSMLSGLPVAAAAAAGTWSKIGVTDNPLLAMKSSTKIYGRPFTTSTLYSIDDGSNGYGSTLEIGMIFTIPTNFGSTVAVRGVRVMLKSSPTSATNTTQVNLYSSPTSSPVQLAKSALIVNDRIGRFGNLDVFEIYFTSTVTLTTGVQYAVAFSTTASQDAYIYCLNEVTQADFGGWMYGTQTSYATRTASSFANIDAGTATGNFSATNTIRPMIDLILDDITPPAGSTSVGGVF